MRYLIFLFLLINVQLHCQQIAPIQSTFNNKIVSDSLKNYSFIVSGHFYGGRSNKTGYPINTVLANLDWINESNTDFIVVLGDLFMDVSENIPKYQKSFFNKLEKPLFNSVGNHDLTGDIYQSNFGKTFYYFIVNNDVHVILDTEKDNGDIASDQLAMLNEIKTLVQANVKISNVFIYGHRTLWARSYSELDHLFNDNTQSKFGNNYESEVLPILKEIGGGKSKVFWYSGSLGPAPASFFHYSDDNITYIATAIRGLPRDAVLVVHVENGEVTFETKSFTAQKVLDFNEYDLNYWTDNSDKKEPFNFRLLPLYMQQMFFHIYFWIGLVSGLFIIVLALWFKRKR